MFQTARHILIMVAHTIIHMGMVRISGFKLRKEIMRVENVIKDEVYQKLIEYASRDCDAIMLATQQRLYESEYWPNTHDKDIMAKTTKELENTLHGDLLKKRGDSQWVYTGAVNPPTQKIYNKGFGIYFYKLTEQVKQYLLSNNNLFSWKNPEYPQDLSFFKKGYCWLYSQEFPKTCVINCANKKEYQYLKSIGVNFSDNFTPTLPEQQYFEAYGTLKDHKDILFMTEVEYRNNISVISKKDQTRYATLARRNSNHLQGEKVYVCDSIKIVPKQSYTFKIRLQKLSPELKAGLSVKIPYDAGSINSREDTKEQIFWFSDKNTCYDFTLKSDFGRAIVSFVFKETKLLLYQNKSEYRNYLKVKRLGEGKALKQYMQGHARRREVVINPDMAYDAGMGIEMGISNKKRVYHCRKEWHHGSDDLIFSVGWEKLK